MKLGDYLRERNITLEAFGGRIGVDESTVSRYVTGERVPRPLIMAEIIRETGGLVTANDFVPARSEPPQPAPAEAAP
jgi:transcriptional regulator with XRE-family HTH domain